MQRPSAIALRWLGRALVLLAPYILVCSLFLPAGVQFLNPLVCPDNTELSNARYALPGRPDNAKLELVCTSPDVTEPVGEKVVLIMVTLITLGLICLYFSQKMLVQRVRIPSGPGAR